MFHRPARSFIVLAAALLIPVCAHAEEKKVLRYAFEIAETGFDPVQLSDLYSRIIANQIFDAPLRYAYLAKPGTLAPNVVVAMPDASPDFKTFTFRLKPGIYFADDPAFKGKKRELVAEDFVYSIKRHFDPRWKSVAVSELLPYDILGLNAARDAAIKGAKFDYDRPVEGLRALDRYTFQFKLGKSSPRFAASLADASIFGAVAREVVEAYGDNIMEHPVGTGPYRLAEWRRSSFIALEKNPGYRDEYYNLVADPDDAEAQEIAARLKGRKLPMIDRVEISIIEESQPRWLSFLNYEQDFLGTMPLDLAPIAIPNNKLSPTLQKRHVQLQRVPRIDMAFVVYNMDDPTIGGMKPEKVALRRAINLALDTDEMIRSLYKFQAFPAQSMVMPMTYGYDPNLRTEIGVTDVAKANALLDVYGYLDRDGDGWRDLPDGSPLELEFSTQPDQRSRIIDEIWKKSMNAIHVKLRYKVAKWPEQLRMTRNGQFMMWQLGLMATGPDSESSLRNAYGPAIGAENLARFRNADFDRIFLEQSQMPDGEERIAKIRELQKILVADAPMNVTAHRYAIDMNYPWVIGYRRWPFVGDWWKYVDVDMALRRKTIGK